MAPVKRKRTIIDPISPVNPRAAASAPTVERRATRSIAPPPAKVDPVEPPRGRRRGHSVTNEQQQPPMASNTTSTTRHPEPPRGKENIPVQIEHNNPLKPTRLTRHSGPPSAAPAAAPALRLETKRPNPTHVPIPVPVPVSIPTPVRPPETAARANTGSGGGRPGRPAAAPLVLPPHQHTVGRSKPITMATSGTQPRQSPTPSTNSGPADQNGNRPAGTSSDRNIDKVVLGNICFRAWYPSYYGKEVLGDTGHSSKGGKDAKGTGGSKINGTGGSKDDAHGANAHGRRDRDSQPMLDRLYVCPTCFKYSKELVTWWEHVRTCERRGFVPGKKIYIHPKGRRTVLVPSGPAPKPGRGKRGSTGQKMIEEVVQDEGEWSVWEVDGEKDVLFCQNLSLFAKLFLDNKSVFFDVTGFNYFLLVYTPPVPRTDPDADLVEVVPPRPQVVGFFSKEKMSWDNNNLACILVFPPWQRKGLGALLMGISYEISRREGVLGGPEKPISDLGKKGYKRFWAGEIARWLLTLDTSDPTEEIIVDVNECSHVTWIAPEDCLGVLREMDIAEDAGKGPPRVKETMVEENGSTNGAASAAAGVPEVEIEDVSRVRISQEAVQAWVTKNGISLERTCDPDGFVEGYPAKPVEGEDDEVET